MAHKARFVREGKNKSNSIEFELRQGLNILVMNVWLLRQLGKKDHQLSGLIARQEKAIKRVCKIVNAID